MITVQYMDPGSMATREIFVVVEDGDSIADVKRVLRAFTSVPEDDQIVSVYDQRIADDVLCSELQGGTATIQMAASSAHASRVGSSGTASASFSGADIAPESGEVLCPGEST
jgi:hypothetical protein